MLASAADQQCGLAVLPDTLPTWTAIYPRLEQEICL
jgi:hypothetical protein